MTSTSPDVTVVIPIKNEAANIAGVAVEVARAMEKAGLRWECLWIDDGSTDHSLSLLEKLNAVDPRQRFLSFERNSGQSAALVAGCRAARGSVIATIDGDGQNDPADLPELVRRVLAGDADMVNGYRQNRQDNLIRKISSRIGNGFRNLTTGKTVRDVGCSTRAFRRECAESFPRFAGMHRFIPTLAAIQGFTLAEVPVNHRPRAHGKSKYNINNRLWVGLYDIFGVMWLKKRAFLYTVKTQSR